MTTSTLMAVAVGDKLPDIEFGPITRGTLALYAGASGDHNLIHIDSDVAKTSGMPDVFAQGMLSFGVLARVPASWAGLERMKSFGARFASMTQVHDLITCSGQVTERFEAEGQTFARVALTATAQNGRETLTGEALVLLS